MNSNKCALLWALLFIINAATVNDVQAQSWTDSTFHDFSRGSLDASGQNMYVSHKGEVRSIRRYDLNEDGYIDLLFNSTHDFSNDPLSVLTAVSPDRKISIIDLDIPGSLSSIVSDLNNDGYPDLVFCPGSTGIQHSRRFIGVVMGGPDGWTRSQTQGLLPVDNPAALSVADINRDGWPEIVSLCADNATGKRILKIYWGGESGYSLVNCKIFPAENTKFMIAGRFGKGGYTDILTVDAEGVIRKVGEENKLIVSSQSDLKITGVHSGDIDNDNEDELLITTEENKILFFKLNESHKIIQTGQLEGLNARQVSVGDADKDGYSDLLVTNFSITRAAGGEMSGVERKSEAGVRIFWGDQQGFNIHRFSSLEVPFASSAVVGDFDGDGLCDVGVAVYQKEDSYNAESVIFYGGTGRTFVRGQDVIPTAGAHHAAVIKGRTSADRDQLVISNSISGTTYEKVPLWLYYGSKDGFKQENLVKIPFASGYESTAADLNDDGMIDVVSVNSMHGGDLNDPFGGVNILWGRTPQGTKQQSFDERTILNEVNASTSNVADLNKDGHLDIVIGSFDRMDKKPTDLIIYYGSLSGYNIENRVAIPSEGRSSSPMIADLNGDGWLDIAVSSFSKDLLRIFWGSENGFSQDQSTNIPAPQVIDLEIADLNNDGHLDIIVCHYKDKPNNHHDAGISILWGSKEGFSNWRAQWLPAYTPLGPVVADFDGDGFLDIFCPSYHGDNIRGHIAMYLYWGAPGGFSRQNRTVFIGDSGTDAMAADFDKDGKIDLAVANHTTGPDHGKARSKVYYNDGKRFTSTSMRIEQLPAPGPHWMWNKDMGHIENRSWKQQYISRVFNWRGGKEKVALESEAAVIPGTELRAFIRSARTEHELDQAVWRTVNLKSPIDKRDRYLQYKYELISDNGDRYPVIKKVTINLK